MTLIRKPLRRPRVTNKASISPRFTRCNTVWRDTPIFIVVFQHGQIVGRCLLDEACPQLIGDSNLPGRSWRYLLTGDETIIQPAMNSGSVDSQDLRSFANRC